MGFIVISVFVVFILCILICVLVKCNVKSEFLSGVLVVLGVLCLSFGIIEGVFGDISGYEEPEVSSIELAKVIKNNEFGGKNCFYVFNPSKNTYKYYIEVKEYFTTRSDRAHMENEIYSCNVKIVEDNIYTTGKLVTYIYKPKKSFWTFALGKSKIEYVFYLPKGTVSFE